MEINAGTSRKSKLAHLQPASSFRDPFGVCVLRDQNPRGPYKWPTQQKTSMKFRHFASESPENIDIFRTKLIIKQDVSKSNWAAWKTVVATLISIN